MDFSPETSARTIHRKDFTFNLKHKQNNDVQWIFLLLDVSTTNYLEEPTILVVQI